MSERARDTARTTERPLTPDDIGWNPGDAPELDDEWFERTDHVHGERIVLPTDLVERFRAGGLGWQIRSEAALKKWMTEHPDRL